MNSWRLARRILIAMVLGIAAGWAINRFAATGGLADKIASGLDIVTAVFLRLIKMIIAPLVLATLATGVAHMRQGAAVGRLFGRTLGWFVAAGLISLSLGLLAVNLLKPGIGIGLVLPPADAASGVASAGLDLKGFFEHIVPTSIAKSMADNEVLQIVVFSLFAGVSLIAIGERGRPILDLLGSVTELMLKMTGYVMAAAPVAVFAAMASVVAVQGPHVLQVLGRFVGGFYLALFGLWAILLGAGALVLGPAALARLLREVRDPFLLAFATASSEAAYPSLLEALERTKIQPRVASFVLPLGYSFNLDGSMMYCAFASLFIAQAYGVHLSLGQQALMLLLLMVTSKGIAGVPRASLVVVAATLPYFNIPASGLLIVIAVDHFLDMGRTATNVIGNAVAAAVIDRWESARPSPTLAAELPL